MCFQRIYNGVQNLILISAFFCNVVHKISRKMLEMCKTITKIPNHSISLLKMMFIKYLNQLPLYQQTIVCLCFFYKIYKQIYSKKIIRKFFRDALSAIKRICILRTINLKFTAQNYCSLREESFMLYFFGVGASPENDKKHSESNAEKEDIPNSENLDSLSANENKNSGEFSENLASEPGADVLSKRKHSAEYEHKLKKVRNDSKVFDYEGNAASECRIQKEALKGNLPLSFSHHEQSLSKYSEQITWNSLSGFPSEENHSIMNKSLTDFQSQENSKILDDYNSRLNENLRDDLDTEFYSLRKQIFSISTDHLNTLNSNPYGMKTRYENNLRNNCKHIADKSTEATNKSNSNMEKFVWSNLYDSNSENINERLRLIPDIEVWNNIENEINELKKLIARKKLNGEFNKAPNESETEFRRITDKDEHRKSADELPKISEIGNQLKADESIYNNLESGKYSKMLRELSSVMNASSGENKSSEIANQTGKMDQSYTSSSLDNVKDCKIVSTENLDFLYSGNKSFEMDGNLRGSFTESNSFKKQKKEKLHEAAFNVSPSTSASSDFCLDDQDVPPLVTYFEPEFKSNKDLFVNIQIPNLPSVLDSPVSEEEYPGFGNINYQNLNASNSRNKTSLGTNKDSRSLASNFSRLQNNELNLPLPMFGRPEYFPMSAPGAKRFENMMLESCTRNSPTVWRDSIQTGKENFSFPSLNSARIIGIEDFEVGECSTSTEDVPRKRDPNYRPYPGQVPEGTKVKKDARYQKRFYKKTPQVETSNFSGNSSGLNLPAGNVHEDISTSLQTTQKNINTGDTDSVNKANEVSDPSSKTK